MIENDELEIENALRNDKYEWRTINGISKEAKISKEAVLRYISEHGDKVVSANALNQKGERLYMLRSKRRKGSIADRFSAAIKNRGD
ncbi:hypothetical protein Y5S_03145 [Alcanivorax nanhaiticus]|uniref:Uncharacterized protein n=1 Tax=Alcanivorax nanhaiticus TaxID=1177154 RepID=A0A095SGP1_9GAMM|nr:hypothetical protein [Alcanivorax nanhaiticus]KGD63509.1 hypothetical protein Y5S_03145 [Alcanivorax nanhaiticus]